MSVSQHEIRKDPWEILNATEHQIRLPHHYFEVGIIPEGSIQTHWYVPDVFPCRRSHQKHWRRVLRKARDLLFSWESLSLTMLKAMLNVLYCSHFHICKGTHFSCLVMVQILRDCKNGVVFWFKTILTFISPGTYKVLHHTVKWFQNNLTNLVVLSS